MIIEKLKSICDNYGNKGWQDLFLIHGLDILADDLEKELSKKLNVDRTQPGFEDFALEGSKGIEPYIPARSLLYHGFASPQVVSWIDKDGNEKDLHDFPTIEELSIVENFVYAIRTTSISELRVRAKGRPLAMVVFASEYRPAINTVHKKHADKCFSRVGISRVGTAPQEYSGPERGYFSIDENNEFRLKVLPCYFSAYIAVQMKGDESSFGPLRFQRGDLIGGNLSIPRGHDDQRDFWVPIHKIFAGKECLRGHDLKPVLEAKHINEKLKKAHRELSGNGDRKGYNTGRYEPELSCPPFVFTDGIADLRIFNAGGEGEVIPIYHESLVSDIKDENGNYITYIVPENKDPYGGTVNVDYNPNGGRPAPEYLHAKHKVEDGELIDLNEKEGVKETIKKGNYNAAHYIDYTGDGFVNIDCPSLVLEISNVKPAYSLVCPTDFFPLVNQEDLLTWWQQSAPKNLFEKIWPENPGTPLSLCDTRYPANLYLKYSSFYKDSDINNKESYINENRVFESEDNTMTAIVSLMGMGTGKLTTLTKRKNYRMSILTDGASGIYAPGWDVSIDRTGEVDVSDDGSEIIPGTTFLSNYGLGSPFPEDAMLCAALSSFWPAAAPDITRSFRPNSRYATSTPLEDNVTGQEGEVSWNELYPPKIIEANGEKGIAAFQKLEYGDFVQTTLDNKFDYSKIGKINSEEYAARTLVMAVVYEALEATNRSQKASWTVFSFKKAKDSPKEELNTVKELLKNTNASVNEKFLYRFVMFKPLMESDKTNEDYKLVNIKYDSMTIIYADPRFVVSKKANDENWRIQRI